ncbi:hypothetical protein [Frankia canadensis]|uniref:hypothetical protein n=1 Tax=Frankia canadensis TaxID=1836972 RepID=UPI000C7B7EA7|nr:hypothetical protein [Frankia canadensis]
MSRRFPRPFRRLGALLTAAALAVGLSAAMALTAPAAQASTCANNPYQGTWKATDPNGHLIVVVIDFPDCSHWNSARVQVVSHAFLGLSKNPDYWGYASSVRWGIYGTSLTATFPFKGLTEVLYITPAQKYTGLPVVETEYFANGAPYTFPTQYLARA